MKMFSSASWLAIRIRPQLRFPRVISHTREAISRADTPIGPAMDARAHAEPGGRHLPRSTRDSEGLAP